MIFLWAIVVFVGLLAGLAVLLTVAERLLINYGVCTVDINAGGRTLEIEGGQTLLNGLIESKIFIPSACGGRGSCGYCKIVVPGGGVDRVGRFEVLVEAAHAGPHGHVGRPGLEREQGIFERLVAAGRVGGGRVDGWPPAGRVDDARRAALWRGTAAREAGGAGLARAKTAYDRCLRAVTRTHRIFSMRRCLERRHDALMIDLNVDYWNARSEEHTSELQSH